MTADTPTDLVVPVEIVPELQQALLADLRSLAGQVLERTPVLSLAFVDIDLPAYVERLTARRELLEIVGCPGQETAREQITLKVGAPAQLAVELLDALRAQKAERVSRGESPAGEQAELAKRVGLLADFLRDQHSAARARRVGGRPAGGECGVCVDEHVAQQ